MIRKNKTVYVLGAGFSLGVTDDLGKRIMPTQENLIKYIVHNQTNFQNEFDHFKDFMINTMNIPESKIGNVPLEDIFTPLDKCINDGASFRDRNVDDARNIREKINYLIGATLDVILRGDVKKDYINKFAKHITDLSFQRADNQYSRFDPVSVISTNWDILLDNAIKEYIDTNYKSTFPRKGVVDYCCHLSSHSEHNHSIKPGLEMLGKGGFNVKLLKLHGSLNWLQCPRCNRLYVEFNTKIAINQYRDKDTCRHCDINFGKNDSHTLTSNLIMPTYVKNLSNAQYKLIWQNAAIEISEASKLVFIGYSLPQADFEMKQLLSRMVRSDAEIIVVDKGDSEIAGNIENTKKRYELFFGKSVKIHWQGVDEYVDNHLAS